MAPTELPEQEEGGMEAGKEPEGEERRGEEEEGGEGPQQPGAEKQSTCSHANETPAWHELQGQRRLKFSETGTDVSPQKTYSRAQAREDAQEAQMEL